MLRIATLLLAALIPGFTHAQLISVFDARALPVGSTVTVNGIVTSGAEFGTIRYLQDGTGGIAVFSPALATVTRGDNVTVTGTTAQFQNLLEITPVSGWTLNSSGNTLPAAEQVTPSMLGENYESMLIGITHVTFTNGGGVFQGNASYNFTSNGESGVVYIRSGHPLVGQTIPGSSVTLYGICSQFGNQYQVLPRDSNDLVNSSAITITTPPYPATITTSFIDIAWTTDVPGDAYLRYGHTPALELGQLTGPVNTANPAVTLSGALPAELFYAQAFSVTGTDTAFSSVKAFITASLSTGSIKVYFNQPVDQYVANPPGNVATELPNAFDDTLKAYIDRSLATLDIAIYSFDNVGTAPIIQAINDAHNRGVRVRVIADGSNANNGLQSLDPGIAVLLSPTTPPNYYGIMHNKFFVVDADHPDAALPVVMTGSTNWSNSQLNTDRNNLVFIQDQGLARVYQLEFEEMWGGNGPQPVVSNSKFGPDKSDNTPHQLSIGGKRVESYFSPSDDTNNQILRTIQSADDELYFATMVFTRFDLAYGIEERVDIHGVYAAGILDDSSGGSGTSFLIMEGAMGNSLLLFDHGSNPGIMHHKYMIADPSIPGSDPVVLTGSHNWSSAANLRNDENTVIIHDPLTANQFYQEFHNLYNGSGGSVGQYEQMATEGISLFPNPAGNRLALRIVSNGASILEVTIHTVTGSRIYESEIPSGAGEKHFAIDTGNFPAGIYVVSVKSGNLLFHKKLIVYRD